MSQLRDVVTAQRLGALYKSLATGKRQQPLHGRIKVVAPAHGQIKMLLLQRNKRQSLAPGRRFDSHANIRFALANGQGEIVFAERRMRCPREVSGIEAVACQQTLQQMADAGIGLAMGQTYAGAGDILQAGKSVRVIGG